MDHWSDWLLVERTRTAILFGESERPGGTRSRVTSGSEVLRGELFDSNPDSNAGEPWRTLANPRERRRPLIPALNFKMNSGEPCRTLADDAPANFKTAGGSWGLGEARYAARSRGVTAGWPRKSLPRLFRRNQDRKKTLTNPITTLGMIAWPTKYARRWVSAYAIRQVRKHCA